VSGGYDLLATLHEIDSASLSYDAWLRCGLALHAEGYAVEDWDSWSRTDTRYKPGDCEKRWRGFSASSDGVTGGSLIAIAREQGVEPVRGEGHALSWNDAIGGGAGRPREHVTSSPTLRPNEQTAEYLASLFGPDEYVCLSAAVAGQGSHHRVGDLVDALRGGRAAADLIDGYDPAAGAWCVVNPTNGRGRKRDDMTAWRHVLVESDNLSEEEQLTLIRKLELPCVAIATS
jgi:hypothetical protein